MSKTAYALDILWRRGATVTPKSTHTHARQAVPSVPSQRDDHAHGFLQGLRRAALQEKVAQQHHDHGRTDALCGGAARNARVSRLPKKKRTRRVILYICVPWPSCMPVAGDAPRPCASTASFDGGGPDGLRAPGELDCVRAMVMLLDLLSVRRRSDRRAEMWRICHTRRGEARKREAENPRVAAPPARPAAAPRRGEALPLAARELGHGPWRVPCTRGADGRGRAARACGAPRRRGNVPRLRGSTKRHAGNSYGVRHRLCCHSLSVARGGAQRVTL